MPQDKPSFFESVISGIAGSVKGLLAGGAVGATLGGLIGGLLGALTLSPAMIGVGAIAGASLLGSTMAAVGGLAGTVTGVVKSRERSGPNEQDIVNLANIAFAQGVSAGQEMQQNQSKTSFTQRIMNERAAQPPGASQSIH
ncbi:MAG: hypothetical protein SFT92_07225 [Rickettsiales bacterium]|nr:hypothetical protein [Rickettsiales bacterium]